MRRLLLACALSLACSREARVVPASVPPPDAAAAAVELLADGAQAVRWLHFPEKAVELAAAKRKCASAVGILVEHGPSEPPPKDRAVWGVVEHEDWNEPFDQ